MEEVLKHFFKIKKILIQQPADLLYKKERMNM